MHIRTKRPTFINTFLSISLKMLCVPIIFPIDGSVVLQINYLCLADMDYFGETVNSQNNGDGVVSIGFEIWHILTRKRMDKFIFRKIEFEETYHKSNFTIFVWNNVSLVSKRVTFFCLDAFSLDIGFRLWIVGTMICMTHTF